MKYLAIYYLIEFLIGFIFLAYGFETKNKAAIAAAFLLIFGYMIKLTLYPLS